MIGKQQFHGYTMNLFPVPQIIELPDSVLIKRCKYGHHVTEMSNNNISILENETNSKKITMDMKLKRKGESYFRSEGVKRYDVIGRDLTTEPIGYSSAKIKISFQGSKEKDGIIDPVWKLSEIRYNYQ